MIVNHGYANLIDKLTATKSKQTTAFEKDEHKKGGWLKNHNNNKTGVVQKSQ